jgi:DNA-binding GntR family transcriptional regulator
VIRRASSAAREQTESRDPSHGRTVSQGSVVRGSSAPLVRVCARDHVRESIVARILDGTYPDGLRLKELSLAAEFGVSQAPVREALRELQALGLVTSERFRGCRVRTIDLGELREAYELRALLEQRSVELAIPLSDGDIESLERDLAMMRTGVRMRDRAMHAAGSVRFHRQIVVLSRNRSFIAAWDSLHWEIRVQIAMRRAELPLARLERIVAMHGDLLRLLRKGQEAAAARKVREIVELFAAQL